MRRSPRSSTSLVFLCISICVYANRNRELAAQEYGPPLPGTKPLSMTGDIASELVAGVDRFLLKQIDDSTANRAEILEAGFFFTGGVQRLGRAQSASGWRTFWGCAIPGRTTTSST